jgi:hypothetical protein
MSEKDDDLRPLTMQNVFTPDGFASLAAAVASQLRQHRKAVVYLDSDGNVLYKDPAKEVAIVDAPVLIIYPDAIELDEESRIFTASLDNCELLEVGALLLEEEKIES